MCLAWYKERRQYLPEGNVQDQDNVRLDTAVQ